MQELFEARCLEAYQAAGTAGIGRWLFKILSRETVSLYKEYLDMMADLFENDREARRALGVGVFFLAGTWIALFFMLASSITGLASGAILVLTNALLVARSFLRSERMEYVAGMAAMTNTILAAGLMAVQASLGPFPAVAFLMQVALIGLHGLLLWRLRGENLTREMQEIQIGE
jgi:hypothetical protein